MKIKEILECENVDSYLNQLGEKINKAEEEIQEKIKLNHQEIIKNCVSISAINIKNTIGNITQTLSDYSLNVMINQNKLKENQVMIHKSEDISRILKDLLSILRRSYSTNSQFEDLRNYYYMENKYKFYKKNKFYDSLKVIVNNKREEIINNSILKCDYWIDFITNKFENVGECIVNEKSLSKKEFNFQEFLEIRYFYEKLGMKDELKELIEKKMSSVCFDFNLFKTIGMIYFWNKLKEYEIDIKTPVYNIDYEKDELILLVKVLKKYKFESRKAEEKLDKICCDYLYEEREYVHNKEEAKMFIQNCKEYLKNVEQPCVIEIFYKCLDDMLIKHFVESEINEIIDNIGIVRDARYEFQAYKKIEEMQNNVKKEIDDIFTKKEYAKLKDLFLDSNIIKYIKKKFVNQKIGIKPEEKKIVEAELVKYYIFLKSKNKEYGDIMYGAIKEFEKDNEIDK